MLKTPFYVVSDTDNTLFWYSKNGVKINWSLNEDLTDSNELPVDTELRVRIPMQAGKKLYLFCTEDQPAFSVDGLHCNICCNDKFSVGGNACFLSEASCYKKTNFQPSCRNTHQFSRLFASSNVADASSMVLGFSQLADNCCQEMFVDCTSLIAAPQLPAMALADGCYANMFNGCTSLTAAPQLPATTLASNCYNGMFYFCRSLAVAPQLPATTVAFNPWCYSNMFNSCTSLTAAPQLPATTLASYCYHNMFCDCTALMNAPQLPATVLASDCYSNMFSGCTQFTDLHFSKSLESSSMFHAMLGAPKFGATNATVHYDL